MGSVLFTAQLQLPVICTPVLIVNRESVSVLLVNEKIINL